MYTFLFQRCFRNWKSENSQVLEKYHRKINNCCICDGKQYKTKQLLCIVTKKQCKSGEIYFSPEPSLTYEALEMFSSSIHPCYNIIEYLLWARNSLEWDTSEYHQFKKKKKLCLIFSRKLSRSWSLCLLKIKTTDSFFSDNESLEVVTAVLTATVKFNKLRKMALLTHIRELRSQGKPQLQKLEKEVGTESHNLPGVPKWKPTAGVITSKSN